MGKRKYTKMQVLLPTIERMIAAGMSHREIEAELGWKEAARSTICRIDSVGKLTGAHRSFAEENLQRRCRNTSMRTSGSRWK